MPSAPPRIRRWCKSCRFPWMGYDGDTCAGCGDSPSRIDVIVAIIFGDCPVADELCPIWDCRCEAGDAARIAFARATLELERTGDTPTDAYGEAWAEFMEATAVRREVCQCPNL